MSTLIEDFFRNIWGHKEEDLSAVIAQSYGLSLKFRAWFDAKIGLTEHGEVVSIQTEHSFGQSDRIDILIEFADGFWVGIENKKWAVLQSDQLHRYDKDLNVLSQGRYKLIFLAPSRYGLAVGERPGANFVMVNYLEIIHWLEGVATGDDLESSYLGAVLEYVEELEMRPLNAKELDALGMAEQYRLGLRKLDSVLQAVRKEKDGTVENKDYNYKLFYRKVGDYRVYAGFRFGTDWYYKERLLNDRPECVVFVKDLFEQDVPKRMAEIEAMGKALGKSLPDVTANFYERKKPGECRLAIRCGLEAFVDKEEKVLIDWFQGVLGEIEKYK